MANRTSNNKPAKNELRETIWLEVANVRIFDEDAQIQIKGDRAEREPTWWKVNLDAHADFKDPLKAYRTLSENLDKKRIVIAGLGLAEGGQEIECKSVRIQYAESATR